MALKQVANFTFHNVKPAKLKLNLKLVTTTTTAAPPTKIKCVMTYNLQREGVNENCGKQDGNKYVPHLSIVFFRVHSITNEQFKKQDQNTFLLFGKKKEAKKNI